MKRYLPFDSDRKLHREIANVISETYPVGLMPDAAEYHEWPGVKRMWKLIEENVVINKNYRLRWGGFLRKIKKGSKNEIVSTTYGNAPSFSADLILERYEDDAVVRVKKISFAVSLIGPFFSICGIDETFIKESGETWSGYHAINVVTVSPYKEFEHDFNYIREQIETCFPNHKFVPFTICQSYIKDIHVLGHTYGEECSVYSALFNCFIDRYYGRKNRGDTLYGFDKSEFLKVTLGPPPPVNKHD